MTDPLIEAIGRAVEALPAGALDTLEASLRSGGDDAAVVAAVPSPHYRELVGDLMRLGAEKGNRREALSLAVAAARDREDAARRVRVSIVWTGPETEAVALRRTDQVLLDLIRRARNRLVVVSYAVYAVPLVAEALRDATQQGVEVVVVLESERESSGNVDFEMTAALAAAGDAVAFYTWPADRRPRSDAGRLASLHAKCAVADGERLLVTSANLTDWALTRNMEIGLLVEGGEIPARVDQHLRALTRDGELALIRP